MFYSDSEDLDEESEDAEQFFYTSHPDLTYQPSEASCLISVNQNIDSLVPLIGAGIMKRPTAENIAGSGLNLHHLRVIARRDTGDGSDNLTTSGQRSLCLTLKESLESQTIRKPLKKSFLKL